MTDQSKITDFAQFISKRQRVAVLSEPDQKDLFRATVEKFLRDTAERIGADQSRIAYQAQVVTEAVARMNGAKYDFQIETRPDLLQSEAGLRAHNEKVWLDGAVAANNRCVEELLTVLPYLCLPLDVD